MLRLMPLLLLMVFSCSKKNSDASKLSSTSSATIESPDIKLKVEGLAEGERVALVGFYLGENYLMDSTRVEEGGLIHFKRTTPYNQGLTFALLENDLGIQMMFSEDQTFSIHTTLDAIEVNAKVNGSLDNELLYETLNFEKSIKQEIATLKKSIKNGGVEEDLERQIYAKIDDRNFYFENLKKEHPNQFFTKYKIASLSNVTPHNPLTLQTIAAIPIDYQQKNTFWDQVDFSDERLLATPIIRNRLEDYMKRVVNQEPDSLIKYGNRLINRVAAHPAYYKFFINWMAINFEPTESHLMDSEAIYVNLVDRYYQKEKAFWLDSMKVFGFQQKAYAMQMSLLGKQGGDIVGIDLNGNQHSIYGQTSDYVALYVFNPKCVLCKTETPRLIANYKKWKEKGINIIAVATNSNEEELRTYIAENDIQFPVMLDDQCSSLYPKYYVNKTPELYLLDQNRIIIGKNMRADLVESHIEIMKNPTL